MKILSKVINTLWEFPCPLCGCDNPGNHEFNSFCTDCLEKLPLLHGPRCRGCGGEHDGVLDLCSKCMSMPTRPWSNAMAAMKMLDSGEKAIYDLKFAGKTAIARALAELSAPLLQHDDFAATEIITCVPLHWLRKSIRGYNQSELLARMLASQLHKPFLHTLKRTRIARRQATLNREERLKNLRSVFAAVSPQKITNRRILLVDDVLTTGATLHACTEALLQAGAASVAVFAAARR